MPEAVLTTEPLPQFWSFRAEEVVITGKLLKFIDGMSPFMKRRKNEKHHFLLVHGEADNNSGTYPMQSERYLNAFKRPRCNRWT